jgi:hypothetical protein
MPRFQAGLLKDDGKRAKPGNRRSKKINTDKSGKEKPVDGKRLQKKKQA